ncbi:MAG: hypothetical protein GDA45_05110 [Chromatiales bacterium]|nr:hypothetical protein [Chromatiales bacterium]
MDEFSSISHKTGNVFFNQKTKLLDTRGGSFLSRIVTWVKSKYNPSKVNQEYKAAVDSFTSEVVSKHNEIFQKDDPNYSINNENLGRLYQLGTLGKPLAARQVKQVLARLDSIESALEIAKKYSSVEYCRDELMHEISKHAEYYGDYQPSQDELEKLSTHIKDAIVNEIYQQEGLIGDDTAASITHSLTKTYARSRTLKTAMVQSNLEDCKVSLEQEISKHSELHKGFALPAADIDRLSLRIRDAIIKEGYWQGDNLSEDQAASIRDQVVKKTADQIIGKLNEQKALYQETVKEQTEQATLLNRTAILEQAALLKKMQIATEQLRSTPTAEQRRPATTDEQLQPATTAWKQRPAATTEKRRPAATSEKRRPAGSAERTQPVSRSNRGRPLLGAEQLQPASEEKSAQLQPQTNEQLQPATEEKSAQLQPQTAEELGIPDLPKILKQQLHSGEIDSKEKLIQASNHYIAGRITGHPLRKWYLDCYKKSIGEKAKEIPSELIKQVKEHIQSMPTLMTYQQSETYMRQAVIDYIKKPE